MEIKVIGKQPNSRMCFVCGVENQFGLKSRFYELENNEIMAIFTPAPEHQSYPGRLHGGIAATILDETIGRAVMMAHADNIWGVTVNFSMRLRKPVPIDNEIRVVGRITKDEKRFFEGSGEILLADGSVAVEGEGKYLKKNIEKIADFDVEGGDWFMVEDDDDPGVITK